MRLAGDPAALVLDRPPGNLLVRSIRCSASRARSEWRAIAAERANVPTTGMLSQISSVEGDVRERGRRLSSRRRAALPGDQGLPRVEERAGRPGGEDEDEEHRVRFVRGFGSSSVKARAPDATARADHERRLSPKSSEPAVKSAIAATRMRFSSTFVQMSLCVRMITASASASKA